MRGAARVLRHAGWPERSRHAHHRSRYQKDVSKRKKQQSRQQTGRERKHLHERLLRLFGEEGNPSLNKTSQAGEKRNQIVKQPRVSRRIAGADGFASHLGET